MRASDPMEANGVPSGPKPEEEEAAEVLPELPPRTDASAVLSRIHNVSSTELSSTPSVRPEVVNRKSRSLNIR